MIRRNGGELESGVHEGEAMHESEVGYCKPPRAHQFKIGQSGNPRGRPKGLKNEATILRELLDQKREFRQGAKLRKLTIREAMFLKCIEAALKGDHKAIVFLLEKYAAVEVAQKVTRVPRITPNMTPQEAAKHYEEMLRATGDTILVDE
jgi:flagellar motility protein MotE (MotC chaperone)